MPAGDSAKGDGPGVPLNLTEIKDRVGPSGNIPLHTRHPRRLALLGGWARE